MKTVSTPIKRKINIIDIKFINRAKYRTSLSLINQNEIAAANNGNLIQAKPLLNDTTKSDEILADMHEKSKKRIANLIQLMFNQFHENLKIEEKINDNAIKTINKSVKDLLIIIKKRIFPVDSRRNSSLCDRFFCPRIPRKKLEFFIFEKICI